MNGVGVGVMAGGVACRGNSGCGRGNGGRGGDRGDGSRGDGGNRRGGGRTGGSEVYRAGGSRHGGGRDGGGMGGGGWGGYVRNGDNPVSNHREPQQQLSGARTSSEFSNKAGIKEKVLGARRVWGTLSICSASAVQNVIKRFCGIESIRVKRNHKIMIMVNGREQWWFVLHDDESIPCTRENKWNLIEVQTLW